MEVPPNYAEQDNITYVTSPNLNGLVELSTLTVETTTATIAYDQLQSSQTTKTFEKTEANKETTTTRRMRKVLKQIYKRPIHSNNYEKINKQDVLLKHSDSKNDLLTLIKGKLTDVIESDKTSMNEKTSNTTVFNNLYEEHKGSLVFVEDGDNNLFGEEKADLKINRDHQSGVGMYEIISLLQ